ncbi:DUF86 domain-containing protein [Paenibacillus sp. J2TS4]|uniref:DUF86 domain-containing protein n=1 Tax=Paenibacillus sp. J2TS4 TaxID=2807194 RepID=UPI001B05839C|nr:HepT-like ribonuclease domain-containing protein [Paenibacillus sp. J2TS4]GIP33783.1 hypothetical protein J2TS4_29930 [Paenibacillus sp. J2TS4]
MYYLNREQLEKCLNFLPVLMGASEQMAQQWDGSLLRGLAQERILHLSIETVTDIGSLLIDGFLMRDASSYEDIVEILLGENVFPREIGEPLIELVKLRKPLVQDYTELDREGLHPLIRQLPALLKEFTSCVREFVRKELGE